MRKETTITEPGRLTAMQNDGTLPTKVSCGNVLIGAIKSDPKRIMALDFQKWNIALCVLVDNETRIFRE
jgi:hypothetical protein